MTRSVYVWPRTRLGWWAVSLTIAFVMSLLGNAYIIDPLVMTYQWVGSFVRGYVVLILVCACGGAFCAVRAIRQSHDSAITVWLSVVPLLLSLIFLLGEILVPH